MATRPKGSGAMTKSGEPHSQEGGTKRGKGLLHTGLKALGTVRQDVVQHQVNVIETLLGFGKSSAFAEAAAPRTFPGLDLGLRKFEEVFDHRVAAAMQRLGLPDALEAQTLREQVRELRERIEQLEGRQKKPPAPRKR